jgi:type IV pilus assembly protein PilX
VKKSTQSGVAMVVVLMVLVVMLFTTVGILRSSNTALGIVGNLGFKQNASSIGDNGAEVARVWLTAQPNGALNNDIAASAYVSNWLPLNWDPLTFDWDANSVEIPAPPDNETFGNRVRYVIHRMCALSGPTDDPLQQCISPNSQSSGGSKQLGGQGGVYNPGLSAVYRVTIRIDGPRNTVAYSQVNVF